VLLEAIERAAAFGEAGECHGADRILRRLREQAKLRSNDTAEGGTEQHLRDLRGPFHTEAIQLLEEGVNPI